MEDGVYVVDLDGVGRCEDEVVGVLGSVVLRGGDAGGLP